MFETPPLFGAEGSATGEEASGGAARALGLLSDAGVLLGGADLGVALEVLARRVVSSEADGCVLALLEESGAWRLAAVACREPAREAHVREAWRLHLSRDGPPLCLGIATSGQPVLIRDLANEHLQAAKEICILHALDLLSCATVPVRAGGALLGVLNLFTVRGGRPLGEADLSLAVALADRVALAVEVARLRTEAELQAAAAREQARRIEQLQHSEALSRRRAERLYLALDAGRMGYFDRDLTTNKALASAGHQALLGFVPGTYDGSFEAFWQRIHPDDRAYVTARIQGLIEQREEGHSFEYRVVWPSGEVRWLESTRILLRDAAGKPTDILGIAWDITTRKQAEEAARRLAGEEAARAEAEAGWQRLEAILDSIGEPLFSLDREWRLQFINRRAEALFGRRREELVGHLVAEEPSFERVLSLLRRHEEELRAGRAVNVEEQLPDGRRYEIHICPFDAGFSVTLCDVTARRQVEEHERHLIREQAARAKAEEAERRSRFLAEVSRSLASSLDHDTTLAAVARLALPVLADCCVVDLAPQSGRAGRVFASPDGSIERVPRRSSEAATKEVEDPIRRTLRTGEVALVPELSEGVRESLGLPERWASLRVRSLIAVPLAARGRLLGAMAFLTAASGRRYREEDLALAWDLAGRAALALDNTLLYAAREEVLRVVSHDLRAPLTVMKGQIDMMQRGIKTPEAAGITLDRAGRHMNRLIEDLLDMTRLDAGTLTLNREEVAVQALLAEAAEMLRPTAELSKLELRVVEADGLRPLNADRGRMLQVLWNLLGNALKFTPSGGRVTLSVEARGDEACFAVADTGPGISAASLERLFERFWQGRAADCRGIGLGLSIAKGLVEAHGGRIWVTSTEGVGTTFFFTIPFAPEGAASPGLSGRKRGPRR